MAERSSGPSSGLGAELREYGHGLSELELVKQNFDDPRHEWRRLFAEVLGTFFLSWSWWARAAAWSTP